MRLKSLFADKKNWGNHSTCVTTPVLAERHRLVMNVENEEVSALEAEELLTWQKEGFQTKKFIFVRDGESNRSTSTQFIAFVAALKASNLGPHCETQRMTLDSTYSRRLVRSTKVQPKNTTEHLNNSWVIEILQMKLHHSKSTSVILFITLADVHTVIAVFQCMAL